MRAVQMDDFRKHLVVRDVPVPEIGDDDALIRVTASGVCRTDWHVWNGDWTWIGLHPPLPTTLGHEIGGVVESVGSKVAELPVGTRVTVPFNFACGGCRYCRKGLQNLCDNWAWPFLLEGSGGFAQYVRVPNANLNCIPLPSEVTELDAAVLGCRYMTAYRQVRTRAAVRAGETVTVVGLGGVGLAGVEIASALGAQVIAVDKQPDRLVEATKLGAIEVINSDGLTPEEVGERVQAINGGIGSEVSLDAVGMNDATQAALESLQKGGRLATVGLTTRGEDGNLTVPIDKMVAKEWSISGSLGNPHADYPELLAMIQNGKLAPRQHVRREIGLDDVQGVFDVLPEFGTRGYVVITEF